MSIDEQYGPLLEAFWRGHFDVVSLRAKLGLGSDDAAKFGGRLVLRAVSEHNPLMLKYGLVFCHLFGFEGLSLDVLLSVLGDSWHQLHEQVVDAVLVFRDPRSVSALESVAKSPMGYRTWDSLETLEVKCVYGLWRFASSDAVRSLSSIAQRAEGPRTRKIAVRLLRDLARNAAVGEDVRLALLGLGLPDRGDDDDDDDDGDDDDEV